MKYFFLSLLLFPIISFSQVKTVTKKVVQLIEPRQIFINSATKLNGKTRIDIKIDLPPNTIEWYYSFSTTPSPSKNNLNLLSQLTRLYDPYGIATVSIDALSVPDGFASVDVFLMDVKGLGKFYKKDIFNQYEYTDPGSYSEGTVKNTHQGKIKIDDITSGTLFLGIRNPSINTGVNVMIEVVAIVEASEYDNSKWSKETKDNLYNILKSGFTKEVKGQYSEIAIEDFCECLVDSIVSKYSPESFTELAEYEKKKVYKSILKECNANNTFDFN
jgi:hypothetical protein